MKDLGLIQFEHEKMLREALKNTGPNTSEQTFTNLYSWRESNPVRLFSADDSYILYLDHGEWASIYGAPVGQMTITDAASTLSNQLGKPVLAAQRVPSETVPGTAASEDDRANYDYVYRREDLATLSGNKYHAKKNLVTQCMEKYDCTYEEISGNNLSEVKDFMRKWCEARRCGSEPGLCHEYRAIETLLNDYARFPVIGAAIRISGNIQAFTIGERLNDDTAVIHFEKASGDFKGLYQLINHWFAKNHLTDFEFINREQDLGIEGLRKAKESYNPHHMVGKATVFFAEDAKERFSQLNQRRCGHHEV